MLDVQVRFEVNGQVAEPEQIIEEYMAEMLEHTRLQIVQQVRHSLGEMQCAEHGGQPRVTVTASYATDSEQMELSYHVDACCQQLLLRAVQALNH